MSWFTYIGVGIMVLGNLWFAMLAFRQSVLWGLAVLFLPGVSLVFLIKNWSEARWAWWFSLTGLAVCFLQKALQS